MKFLFKHALVISYFIFSLTADAAIVSRVTSFSDGQVLFASQLNNEFNNLISGINSINNDQIASNANISASKLSATLAGDGITRDGTTGALSISVDDSSIEIDSNTLQVKDGGISNAKIRDSAAVSVIGRSANSTGDVADIAAASNGQVLKRESNALVFDSVDAADITDGAVTFAKRAARTDGGAGAGTGQIARSNALTSQALTGSFADLTNLSITITTQGGPVRLELISSDGASSDAGFDCEQSTQASWLVRARFLRDGTSISLINFESSAIYSAATFNSGDFHWPPSAFSHMDFPAAGTYTYKVQATESNVSGNACTAADMRLVVYEL